jgi:hypothetical protein
LHCPESSHSRRRFGNRVAPQEAALRHKPTHAFADVTSPLLWRFFVALQRLSSAQKRDLARDAPFVRIAFGASV